MQVSGFINRSASLDLPIFPQNSYIVPSGGCITGFFASFEAQSNAIIITQFAKF